VGYLGEVEFYTVEYLSGAGELREKELRAGVWIKRRDELENEQLIMGEAHLMN
jgi:hypothetical protein